MVGNMTPLTTCLSRPGDDPGNPTYNFTKPNVGYLMLKGQDPRQSDCPCLLPFRSTAHEYLRIL